MLKTPLTSPLHTEPSAPPASVGIGTGAWPTWLKEPLLPFLVLGAMVFAVDHYVIGRSDDPHVIVMGADVDAEARALFKASRGRLPTDDELAALRRVWLDNEVLYREGLALQVDRGDTAIRERVIFKALSVVDASVKLPPFDDKTLRTWFESHRVKYDEPQRYDFLEAVLAGDNSEAAVRTFVDALNAGAPGDAKAGLRVFKGRPHSNLVESYGAEFARAFESLPPGEWRALPSRDGLRVMRVEAVIAAKPGVFEVLRGIVQQDWTDATLAEQRSAAVREMAKKYHVKTMVPTR